MHIRLHADPEDARGHVLYLFVTGTKSDLVLDMVTLFPVNLLDPSSISYTPSEHSRNHIGNARVCVTGCQEGVCVPSAVELP